jgi:hypothetical protein
VCVCVCVCVCLCGCSGFKITSYIWFVKILARTHDNVSEWGDMSIRGLLFQCACIIQIQLSVLVYYKADLIIISLKINLSSPWYIWKFAELALNSNHYILSYLTTCATLDISLDVLVYNVSLFCWSLSIADYNSFSCFYFVFNL